MAQITSGIRKVLSNPYVYDAFQAFLGADPARQRICNEYFRPKTGDVIVDVGCGTAEILVHFPPDVQYFGFDLEPSYIDMAQARFGSRGHFRCADITGLEASDIPPCDLAIAFGVLHHLDDDGAQRLLENLYQRLSPGGRLVTVDPAFHEGQSRIARSLIERDRGQNVRTGQGYLELVPARFSDKRLVVRHDLLRIPYTHAIIESTK